MNTSELITVAKKFTGVFELSEKNFQAGSVAAAIITKKGNIYTGISIDLACGIGFCAEHAAIADMLKHRETEIDMIVAVSTVSILVPCGRCREMMLQVDRKNLYAKILMNEFDVVTLDRLLPYDFQNVNT
ncbi:cytidine deaminase [bacterium]|nr:cytidine deaminase [bacterium]